MTFNSSEICIFKYCIISEIKMHVMIANLLYLIGSILKNLMMHKTMMYLTFTTVSYRGLP